MRKSRTATRTVLILELIANQPKGITLSEISERLEVPITSTKDIVNSLLDLEMIELVDKRSKLYGIGVKAYHIGNTFMRNTTLIDKARTVVEELGSALNKTVFIGREINEMITYIYKYEPSNLIVATCPIGSRAYLHSTALGKVFLANDEELLRKLADKPLLKQTKYTITDYDKLCKDIEKVRLKGYAIDNLEQADHLFCIAAPIFDGTNKIIAALSVSGLRQKVTNPEEEARVVMEKAAILSKKMGYREPVPVIGMAEETASEGCLISIDGLESRI